MKQDLVNTDDGVTTLGVAPLAAYLASWDGWRREIAKERETS